MKDNEVVKIIKDGKAALRAHREKERVRPGLDDKIIVSWNGIAIGALARTAAVIKGFDPVKSEEYLKSALKAATLIKDNLYDDPTKTLYRIWREGRGETKGFADDYAFLIDGLIDLYEATFNEEWLHWADDLQRKVLCSMLHTSLTTCRIPNLPLLRFQWDRRLLLNPLLRPAHHSPSQRWHGRQ